MTEAEKQRMLRRLEDLQRLRRQYGLDRDCVWPLWAPRPAEADDIPETPNTDGGPDAA